MREKTKVCVYTRISTLSDAQQETLESVTKYFSTYFDGTNMELVNIYSDQGKSGTSAKKRTSFLQMLYDAGVNSSVEQGKLIFYRDLKREPLFKTIYVPTLSRFGRDILIVDAVRELKIKGVNVISIEGGLDSGKDADMRSLELFFYLAQQESVMKSERMRQALDRTAKEGKLHIHRLYGYNYSDGRLAKNEEQASVVREVFDLYLKGYGIRRIAKHLNGKGIPDFSGNEWRETDVKRVLMNEKYCGRLIRNKLDTGTVFLKHAPIKKDSTYITQNHENIEAIISVETFDQVQEMYQGKVQSISNRGIYRGISDYAGMIVCVNCGSNYTANTGRNMKPIFNCSGKKKKGASFCRNKNISLLQLEGGLQRVADEMLPIMFTANREHYIEQLEKKIVKLKDAIDQQDMKLVSDLDDELVKIKEKKKRLASLFADGKIEKETLDELLDEANSEMQELERRKADANKTNADIFAEITEVGLMIHDLQIMKFNSEVSTIADVLKHISKITVIDGSLFYKFKMFEHITDVEPLEYHDLRTQSDYSGRKKAEPDYDWIEV